MELNPFSWEFHEDPHPTYRWLRDQAPIYRNDAMDFWAISRFQDVMGAFLDWQTYSSVGGLILEKLDPAHLELTPMMIFMDPPRHDRLRKLVSRVFTPRRVAALEPFVRTLAQKLLDPLAADGGGDFVADFSTPLPMDVIFTLLGVPEPDRRELREWIDVSLARDAGTDAVPSRAIEAGMNSLRYWFQFVQHLRAHRNEGLICDLFDAEIEDDGGRLDPPHRRRDRRLLLAARCRRQRDDDPAPRLRRAALLAPSRPVRQHRGRPGIVFPAPSRRSCAGRRRRSTPCAPCSATSSGTAGPCRPTSSILLLAGAANRDEREYPDPDRFDIERGIPTQLGLGQGVHYCLGASLARLEARVALEEFGRTLPALRGRRGRLPARAHEQRSRLRARAVPPHLSRESSPRRVDSRPIGVTSRPPMRNATSGRQRASARCPPRATT